MDKEKKKHELSTKKALSIADVVSMYCDCEKPTLGVNTWTCGCGKWFKKVKK